MTGFVNGFVFFWGWIPGAIGFLIGLVILALAIVVAIGLVGSFFKWVSEDRTKG